MNLTKKNNLTILILLLSFNVISQNTENNKIDTLKKSNIQDTIPIKIYVGFVVTKKGKIEDVKVVKTEGGPCSNEDLENYKKEALRVITSMPNYKESNEEKRFLVPIKFGE